MEKNWTIIENKNDEEFDDMLCAAIDEMLNEVLGEKGAKTVYYFAKNAYDIEQKDVAKEIQKFQTLLNDLFKLGAILMEQTIMEKLYSKVSAHHKHIILDCKNHEQFDFINYITGLKAAFKRNCCKEG
jgi:hypothetical protein